jgi:hypothetical protein
MNQVPDGTVTARTGGNRQRTYAVTFKGGEAVEVDVEASRVDTRPFWRLVWRKVDGKPMTVTAACAVRAAIAEADALYRAREHVGG